MSNLPLTADGQQPASGDVMRTADGIGECRWTVHKDGYWQTLVSYEGGGVQWWATDELEVL